MSDIVLIDTDVLIDAGRGIGEALSVLQQAEIQGQPAISVVTEMELVVGCRNKQDLNTLVDFLDRFEVISLDAVISQQAVVLLRQYRLSHGLRIPDALIAATAITQGIPLISKNQKDYRFMDRLNLLPYPDPFSVTEL